MKVLAINTTKTFRLKSSVGLRNNMLVSKENEFDLVTFGAIDKQKKSQDEAIAKTLNKFERTKQLRLDEKKAIKRLESYYNPQIEVIDKKIEAFTTDAEFIADTVVTDKERTAWANVAHAVYLGNIQDNNTHKQAQERSMEQSKRAINLDRMLNPQEFLEETPKHLDDKEADKKYQQLRVLYQQKVDVQNNFDDEKNSVKLKFSDKLFDIDYQEHIDYSGFKNYKEYITAVANTACKSDEGAQKVWDDTYSKKMKWYSGLDVEGKEPQEHSKYLAVLDVISYLKGVESFPF